MRTRGEGTHEGCPYGWITGAHEGGGHPGVPLPRGVPLRLDNGCARGGGHPRGVPLRLDNGAHRGEGTHARGGGHPRGVPLRLDNEGAHGGEGTHEGCPYGWITGAHGGEGTHEGCPYGWITRCARGGGHPHKGAPYPIQAASRGFVPIRCNCPVSDPAHRRWVAWSGLLLRRGGLFLTGAEGESKVAAGIQHFSWVVMAAWWDWEDRN